LNAYGSTVETQAYTKLEIHHHPDHTKSRSQYLPLLEMSVREAPQDDRNCFYYARELYFYGKYKEAAAEFRRHLSLPSSVWPPERAASMRYLARLEPEDREGWLQLAIEEAPGRREALVEMAQHWYMEQDWEQCYKAAKAALSIEEKPLEYLCEEFAWGWLPYDLAAIASYRLENYEEALELGKKALELNPEDARLADNLKYYTDAVT
jgi:tetratricopeptide (TPR) repeat protein